MKLYSYWRSTAAYRVRAGLSLKGITHEIVPVDLLAEDRFGADYRALNPTGSVPTLVLDDGTALTQSLAILDYVDACWPAPRLIPADPLQRARVLAAAHTIALDIHPINNLRVVQQLEDRFGATPDQKADWMRHWMAIGFAALEQQVDPDCAFAFSDTPGLADLCILAQVYNAGRWDMSLEPFPNVARIATKMLDLPVLQSAHPDNQIDAPTAR